MAWEQQCPAIIALTKCVEKGRDKCHQYWPDAERMTVIYADIEVIFILSRRNLYCFLVLQKLTGS